MIIGPLLKNDCKHLYNNHTNVTYASMLNILALNQPKQHPAKT
ncbi:hypothetical protein [Candidatus Gullanella endobia]|nr:hypothetical protein [Candidatus Gullanella endobia]